MKTMKHTIAKYFAAAAALCLTAVGCSTLQEDKGVSENRDIRFSASIGSFQVKATDTAFENGDAIGLYAGDHVKAENVRLDWKDGALTPETPVQWGFNQLVDESTLFAAYYPYTAEPQIATDEGDLYLTFSVQKDQSTHAAYTASDLMTASTYATPAEGTVNFTFIHRLSKLVLTVDNRLNDPVKEVYVGNVRTSGIYDIVHSQDYGSTGEPSSVKACEGVTAEGTKAWSVIIPSQSCQITLTLVTESGKEYTYKSENYVYFAAARRYTAQVILDETAISTSFSATVYDWIDNGGFWFRQPNPLFNGQWAIVGTINGTNWDKDFYMLPSGDNLYAVVTLHAGDEFKFRRDGDWTVNFGAADATSVGPASTGNYGISRDGKNFVVERDGVFYTQINLDDNVLFMSWMSDIPTPEGTSIWTGKAYLNNWESSYSIASKDVWVNNGLQEGDEIRFYYDGGHFDGKEYWVFNVWNNTWNLSYGFDSGEYSFWDNKYWTGYKSLYVDWEWYNALTSQDSGNDAGLYIMGENVTVTAITLISGGSSSQNYVFTVGDPQDVYDSSYTVVQGVKQYTVDVSGEDGSQAASFALVLNEDSSDFIGYYKVMEYPTEDHTAGNGYDFPDWGISGGSCVWQNGERVNLNAGDWIEINNDGDAYVFSTPYAKFRAKISLIGIWSVIGTINGSYWDKDFPMTDMSPYGMSDSWAADIYYNKGEEFKFRKSGSWDENLGIDGGWTDTGNNTYSATMIPGGPNITLPMEGQWTLMLNTVENTLSATYNAN